MLLSEWNVAYHCSKSLRSRNEWVIAWNAGNKVLGRASDISRKKK